MAGFGYSVSRLIHREIQIFSGDSMRDDGANNLFGRVEIPTFAAVNGRLIVKNSEAKAMIIIPVKEGENIERALKRFKRKFDRTGTMREIRRRQAFVKPSVRRREEILHACYVQHMQEREE